MPLSEHEQKILDEIERRLVAEDPRFARSTTTLTAPRSSAVSRVRRGIAAFAVGLGLLIGGLFAGTETPALLIALGVAGFAVMLLGVVVIARASSALVRPTPGAPTQTRTKQQSWFTRAEERWRQRYDERDSDR
jgi:hypothetical protein